MQEKRLKIKLLLVAYYVSQMMNKANIKNKYFFYIFFYIVYRLSLSRNKK